MKNIMSLMLGLSLLVGATAMFAQKPADTTSTKTTKKHAKSKKKTTKTDTTKTS